MALVACSGGGGSAHLAEGASQAAAFAPAPVAGASPPAEVHVGFAGAGTLVEDFPLSAHVRYEPGARVIARPVSVDFHKGAVTVVDEGGAAAAIEVADELRHAPQDVRYPPEVLDADAQGPWQWFVTGDGKLHQRDAQTGALRSFVLGDDLAFSELAASEDFVWLYERRQHQLLRFEIATAKAEPILLKGELAQVSGLSADAGGLWLLGAALPAQMVVRLEARPGAGLVQAGAWRIDGFDHRDFNDLTRTPDARWIVSRAAGTDNLYLLADKNRFKGEGPIASTATLVPALTLPLPPGLAQPSGLHPRKDGTWLLVTDQAELKVLTQDFSAVLGGTQVRFEQAACAQGCTEAVIAPNDGEAFVVTDSGWVAHYRSAGPARHVKVAEFRLPLPADFKVAGIAHDPASGRYYVVNDSEDENQDDRLLVLDAGFGLLETHALRYDGPVAGSINSYRANGLVYREGALYLLSSTYTKLLKLDLGGRILAAYEFDEVDEPTDLAFRDGHWWITGDHEDGEPVPPVAVYEAKD